MRSLLCCKKVPLLAWRYATLVIKVLRAINLVGWCLIVCLLDGCSYISFLESRQKQWTMLLQYNKQKLWWIQTLNRFAVQLFSIVQSSVYHSQQNQLLELRHIFCLKFCCRKNMMARHDPTSLCFKLSPTYWCVPRKSLLAV